MLSVADFAKVNIEEYSNYFSFITIEAKVAAILMFVQVFKIVFRFNLPQFAIQLYAISDNIYSH